MGNLEITIEDKIGSEVQNKYDIDELLLMLTLRHTLTNRNSISPCKTCTSHVSLARGRLPATSLQVWLTGHEPDSLPTTSPT